MSNYVRKETTKNGGIYYYNDKDHFHRLDGPAIEYADGGKFWYVNGKYHRLDGPAIEWSDGGKHWYINHELLTKEEFNKHPLVIEYRLGKIISEVLGE